MRTPLGEITELPRPHSWFSGSRFAAGEGKEGGKGREGGKWKGLSWQEDINTLVGDLIIFYMQHFMSKISAKMSL